MLVAALFASAAAAADWPLTVVPLQHRPAAELLPLLQPFVAQDGVVRVADGKLIIRTRPDNLAELRTLIQELDRVQRRVLITVGQVGDEAAVTDLVDHDADEGVGRARADVSAPDGPARVRVWRTESRSEGNRMQRLQVLDGEQAFIDVGKLIPITDYTIERSQHGDAFRQHARYAATGSGFYVRPHLNGDNVTLDIASYQSAASGVALPPAFSTQTLRTTVTGKLGEWLEIAGSRHAALEDKERVISRSTLRNSDANHRIVIKVTEMTP